ncbi:ROK family protein [Streptomyces sp. NPDC056817]|uniref:ROK family transcriptional regulator n=1 Tax=Streptomyces sp. NPDC056817 TaxID=3345950 RepID=UPI0036A7EBCD
MPPLRRLTATTRAVSRVNQTVLLETLRAEGPASRQQLAALTGLSSATVNRLVEALKREGLIVDAERAPSTGGRPPQLIRYNADAQTVLALALGPRRIIGAVADLAGTVRYREERPTLAPGEAAPGDNEIFHNLLAFIRDLAKRAGRLAAPPRAVAVGVPGVVGGQNGRVEFAPALGWRSMPLAALLTEELGLPVAVENNVNLIALATHRHGPGIGMQHMAVVVAEVGVGAGLILGGSLHRGRLGGAGEVGYLLLEHDSLDRPWPGFGDLESRIGLAGIGRRMAGAGFTVGDGELPAVGQLFEAARSGNGRAGKLVRELADDFSLLVANVAVLLSPEQIALGGETFRRGADLLLPAIEARLQGRIPAVPRLVVVESADVEIVGAAELAIEASAGTAFLTH